jgi:hypothetical protein
MLLRVAAAALLLALPSFAALKKIYVVERTDVLDGRSFGSAGPYERIIAKAHFAVDPALPANQRIHDLPLAPKNADGLVEFTADLYILKPRMQDKGNGVLLYEVSNRGNKGLLSTFQYAPASRDPRTAADFGDLFLLEQGYTLAWLGWQFDLPADPTAVRIELPILEAVTGPVRAEFVPNAKTTTMPLADRGMRSYPVADPATAQLLVRDTPDSLRRPIPRALWKLNEATVEMAGGFVPGKFYELIYTAKGSAVAGLGMAATRDLVSFLKYTNDGIVLLGDQYRYLKRAIAFGTSQSGRFLRNYLYDGFNADESGRRVFDGVWAHVAGGGRGSFNQRFAQPSRTSGRMNGALYPTDIYPFADLRMLDPETREAEGLLTRSIEANVQPKIFYTNGSHEYWGRAASLIHTSLDGRKDDGLGNETRAYLLAGTQHGTGTFPPSRNNTAYLTNPADARPVLRALLTHLTAWVKDGKTPPPSRLPLVAKGELVPLTQVHFPVIPGVRLPKAPHQAFRTDYGPDFASRGIGAIEPPKAGKPFPTLLPQVDADGNETAGIRLPDVQVPLGTYTGWNLRDAAIGAPTEQMSLIGGFHPFPATKAQRAAKKDPRPAIEERYSGKDDYTAKINAAIADLIAAGFVLPADKARLEKQASDRWDKLTAQ